MYGQSKHVVGGLKRASWILVTLAFVLLATTTNPGHSAVSNPQENVNLYTGNRLVISSNQPAIQSVFVRYRWIRFEDERRRLEGHLPPFDRGNKIYLWIDVVFRILLAGFIISLAIMIGEVLVIAVAEYLFFVNLNLFSLVDFFSLFFVAALGTIIYLAREGLDKFFDLKPIMED